MRPIILNGIEDVVTRPDLADRAIMLTLEPISDEQGVPRGNSGRSSKVQPFIFGRLLDGVSHGLRMLPTTELVRKPRMADFALWATACEGELDLPCTFDTAYSENRAQAVETVIDTNPIADTVRTLMRDRAEWKGTATDLLLELGSRVGIIPAQQAVARRRPRADKSPSARGGGTAQGGDQDRGASSAGT